MAKILVVEDDTGLAAVIYSCLAHNYHVVEVVTNGAEALQRVRSSRYDLVLLDLRACVTSGIQVLERLRAGGIPIPVVVIGQDGSISEKEAAYGAGADDFLCQPFHMLELKARVRALLRRPPVAPASVLRFGDLIMEIDTRRVFKSGKAIELARKEFELLKLLMRHPGQVFSCEALLYSLWSADPDPSPEVVRTFMKKLRRKIDDHGKPSLIRNLHGVGYKLEDLEYAMAG